ncbi:transmembrane protein [Rhynchospora pubera]|uniref:Transmembrane protein n=1 Tax=Rhynchospora pubera TaxID=906938 RepID=A0AAV8FR65_9POAL|nr:transmembrane protein [Rhynchospora pubera]
MGAYEPNPNPNGNPNPNPNPNKDEDDVASKTAPAQESSVVPSLSRAPGVRNDVVVLDQIEMETTSSPPSHEHEHDHNLFQVMKAVEDAEATIKQQLEENNKLKQELLRNTQELHRLRLEASVSLHSNPMNTQPNPSSPLQQNGPTLPSPQPSIHADDHSLHTASSKQHSAEHAATDSAPHSRISTPSSRSLSPTRHRKEGESDPRINFSSQGLMPVSEVNSNLMWKQELMAKVREHEEEIAQLRKHLSDYSMKESQILNEKYVLEKRIAYMRMAFDQQQQDLVDAASKALSYRQDIIEENIRLTYALQAAQQERSTFVSSLLPLLSEYSLQPSVLDAQSIVSSVKILFRHLQEKLIITEEKLKESQYQITPLHTDYSNNYPNNLGIPPSSPSHGKALVTTNTGLDIVPQQPYGHSQSPMSSPSVQPRSDWDAPGHPSRQHVGLTGPGLRNPEIDNMGRSSPSTSRNHGVQESPSHPTHADPHVRFSLEPKDHNLSFKDLARGPGTDLEDPEVLVSGSHQHAREASAQWGPATSPNHSLTTAGAGAEDPNVAYPYLPTVLEEPSSSFSEAAEDDPLPAIEGLRITGDAFPGRELQASGYSINGTTSCNFEWVRHHEDGSINFIDGAKQPSYLVTADDVDAYLAIEVQPLDEKKRKGELVRVFANDQKKITCDPETQEQIKKNLSLGHISYDVELSARFMDIWEQAVLVIKREGYSIKCSGPRGVVVVEKFEQATSINIPYGRPSEFVIQTAQNVDHVLRTAENGMPRDSIVLTMRLFKMMAVEKKKAKRRGLFFKLKRINWKTRLAWCRG